MTSTPATNQAVLDALCIDGKYITSLTLRMDDPAELPKVTITRYLSAKTSADQVTERFELVMLDDHQPPEPPLLDLDAIADAARARLAQFIDTRARQVHSQVEEGFYKARLDFDVSRQIYTWLHGADLVKPCIEFGVDTRKFFQSVDKSRDALHGYITSSQRVTGSKGFLSPFPLTGLL